MKKMLSTLLFLLAAVPGASAQKGFAIVVDPKSYQEAKTEITDYAAAIERTQGLKIYYIVDRWGVPDSIRHELHRLYTQPKHPIEGAVFLGDIPVPMIRDGQHLTSAFKMDQKHPRKASSIPSDRFYDDFDLKFTYLDKETDAPYFYYSLTAESAQALQPELYTGRVRPTDCNGTSRYDKLRSYLKKATAAKAEQNPLDQLFFFGGHGYISESMTARMDEKVGLYEHFPWLKCQRNGVSYIDHSMEDQVKFRVMNEVMRPELDLALLHHHGAWDTQYLSGMPKLDNAEKAKAFIQSYSRSKIREAKDRGKEVEETLAKYAKRFDVPTSWFADTFQPDVMKQDSLDSYNMDINLADFALYGYQPNSRVVILDACFCGSFHRDDCMANEYIFSPGKTVAVVANTVNALQDKWSDKLIGLLGLGMNVGQLSRYSTYLENHTLGDPTFRFTSHDASIDVQQLLAIQTPEVWNKMLKTTHYPELQVLALEELAHAGEISTGTLLHIFRHSDDAIVRVQALVLLSEKGGPDFLEAIRLACDDSYELVQRFGIRFLARCGDESLIPSLIRIAIQNNLPERVNFNTVSALTMFPTEKLLAEFDKQFNDPSLRYIDKEKVGCDIRRSIEKSSPRWALECDKIVAKDTKEKTRRLNIRSLRNYCPHYKVPMLLDYLDTCDADSQVMLLEALGWQTYSYQKTAIIQKCQQMSQNLSLPTAVRKEALKTANRLK